MALTCFTGYGPANNENKDTLYFFSWCLKHFLKFLVILQKIIFFRIFRKISFPVKLKIFVYFYLLFFFVVVGLTASCRSRVT